MIMPHRNHALRIFRVLALSAIVTATVSAAKLDLERVTPVPADQPIPVIDFFRPHLLQDPKLNPSGTHIAALITAAEDKHQLLVYELKTKKIETAGGFGDQDIYQVNWLNDSRLVFKVSTRKMYGLGLLAGDVGSLGESYPLLQYYGAILIAVPPKNRLHPLVWNRYDALETGRDLGAATIDSNGHKGGLIDLVSAGADHSTAMDARDNNECRIETRYSVPSGGLTYSYLADQDGQLAFAFTSEEGQMAMHRLVEGQWIKCPVDLENIDVIGCGDQPGQVVVRAAPGREAARVPVYGCCDRQAGRRVISGQKLRLRRLALSRSCQSHDPWRHGLPRRPFRDVVQRRLSQPAESTKRILPWPVCSNTGE
jgi:hypothetical protein